MSDVIAIQHIGPDPFAVKVLLKSIGKGAFAGTRKPREPHDHRTVAVELLSVGFGDAVILGYYVGG